MMAIGSMGGSLSSIQAGLGQNVARQAVIKAGLTIDDIDLIQANEAFAANGKKELCSDCDLIVEVAVEDI